MVMCPHLSVFVMDLKMEIPSKKVYVLGIGGLFYLFDAVDEDPTSTNVRHIQRVARSTSMLEDCSPVAFIKMVNQTSSRRGHERSFTSFLLFVEVNLSTKTPLHERYLSLGFKAK
ncbi:hypothetical protein Bca52824_059117 [Brassica carinata]|uniref:Uncharacterized protein n=1 Tax=Brassica carinata TaxID=52824 RepID=A0A8X7QUK7_BRACI|nr:hypothetical protein Bca52824_059117 [Brassica carinata]